MLQYKPDTSVLIPHQIPRHIRENPDYRNFILFLKAYYEWLDLPENTGNLINNISDYKDIDKVPDKFVDYFYNNFLPYFPQEILADKTKVSKIARELYKAKGTPASYKFLFKVLYDSDVDFLYTKDVILKTSDGKWYISKSLRLSSTDEDFLLTPNYKLFGLTSKSIATIEAVTFAKNKIEVFISDIQRLFQSGEFVKVVNDKNLDVYFKDGKEVPVGTSGAKLLTAKILGQISQVKINPKFRGSTYIGYNFQETGYPGDPIVFYGGLASNTGIGAEASVLTTTSGILLSVNVLDGGFGYTDDPDSTYQKANTLIVFPNLEGFKTPPIANVGALDLTATAANVTIGLDTIERANNYRMTDASYLWSKVNPSANANTAIINALELRTISTYPISKVVVNSGGGGLTKKPTVAARSLYSTVYDYRQADLKNLGVLAPIKIINPGNGYVANDMITIIGGTGAGAYAKVNTVSGNGAITSVTYINPPGSNTANNFYPYPLGGLGYHADILPSANVVSSNGLASNAVLSIPGILGDGAKFEPITDKVGQITSIKISNYGEDYISAPKASFRIQDIVVKNLYKNNLPRKGDVVYQGSSLATATYKANVEKIDQVYPFANELDTLYYIRIFDYNKPKPNVQQPLLVDSKSISMKFVTTPIPKAADYPPEQYSLVWNERYDTDNNIYTYGDGQAKANVTFLNGLTMGDGQYLDTSGQLSSFNVLQSADYNNFTYQITLEKEIEKYRKILLELLHPSGTKVRGRFAMKSNNKVNLHSYEALYTGRPLSSLTSSTVEFDMVADFNNPSNNIIKFSYLGTGTNIANIFLQNTTIKFTDTNGYSFSSKINTVNATANTITLTDNVWLSFANVAIASNANSNVINITAITNSYNVINGGVYTDPYYPLKDILKVGDTIKINNMIRTVSSIDYLTNKFSVSADLSYNASGYLSVTKTYHGTAQNFIIYGPLGLEYRTEIVDESGLYTITDELGNILLLD
jgi:hypothetical protein